jgi:GxxExxY protein
MLGESKVVEPDEAVDLIARRTIGAALEVHRVVGPGFLEVVYEEALCVELSLRAIPFVRQIQVPIWYKDQQIGEGRLDLLVADCLIVELKAVEALAPIHTAQLLSYLRATGQSLGLLINFNVSMLRQGIKRVALTR